MSRIVSSAAQAALALLVVTAAVYLVMGGGPPTAPIRTLQSPTPTPTPTLRLTPTLLPTLFPTLLPTRPQTGITPTRPTTPYILGKRVAFLGDSYTAGFGATPRTSGYAYRTSQQLKLVTRYYGQGGTGYVDDGKTVDESNTPFVYRIGPIIADNPHVIVVQGGLNDADEDLQAIQTAAVDVLSTLRERVPTARLVVIGPFYPVTPAPAQVLATRDVLADVARYVGATFLDPIAGNWLDPSLVGPDGVHPTNTGHAAIAARLAAELLKL